MTRLALLVLLSTLPAMADIAYRGSVVAYSGCAIADTATSWGREELNPALRSPDGRFGTRAIAIKGVIAGASLGIQWLTRRRSQHSRAWTVVNYVSASAWCGASAWNYQTR